MKKNRCTPEEAGWQARWSDDNVWLSMGKQQKEILTFSRTSSAQTTCCKHRLMWPKFTRLKNDNDNGLHVNFRKLKHTKTHLCWKKTPAKECCQKTAKSIMMRIGKVTSPEVLALTFPPSALPRDFHNNKVVSIIVKNEDWLTKCVQHALQSNR